MVRVVVSVSWKRIAAFDDIRSHDDRCCEAYKQLYDDAFGRKSVIHELYYEVMPLKTTGRIITCIMMESLIVASSSDGTMYVPEG